MKSALLVDDNEAKRYIIRRALAGLGIKITESDTYDSALRAMDRVRFDAAIIDYQLPGTNGFQLAAAMRGKAVLPIMMVSTYVPRAVMELNGDLVDVVVNELDSEIISRQFCRLLKLDNTILIIEDDLDTLDAISIDFSLSGFCVVVAENRQTALTMLSLHKPDFVLSDWMMSGMSLVEFTNEARKLHPDIPIVLMSAALEDAMAEARQLSLRGFLQKPFAASDFLKKFLPTSR